MSDLTNNKRRRYESRSTEDLPQLLNNKKLKELERLTNTNNFDKFFEKNVKNKKVTPNLNASRSRSNSRDRPSDVDTGHQTKTTETDDGFKTPRRFIKRRSTMKASQDGATARKIPEGEFWVKDSDKDYITVRALSIEIYRLIKGILDSNKIQYYISVLDLNVCTSVNSMECKF
ncbi:hypothetical protein KQX54_004866 [Cotesia glomerata]|uniref:Uncharacterized protein n=1 Tax=Cotesia glomerata TaxID=32391 RepID=A0AAV7ISW1_COTGL|nr:hypothetical protein KQX54_004866 [Cotesia glomerata]